MVHLLVCHILAFVHLVEQCLKVGPVGAHDVGEYRWIYLLKLFPYYRNAFVTRERLLNQELCELGVHPPLQDAPAGLDRLHMVAR